ncbi:hypothetical protein M409DRAFT_60687 [Zasmidium cellare ATCC 36951]|uniref:BTB domain-containing protein n=1 Tax=Zasmidium cellare ATCC 36951 TaxID=1080233 RepID=A0A6A6C037_ZASCE|nr:uncharacterized protein M409DRAFT_60687 [Zasmidium cellare ATCC 36951]KAF2159618.1 hypothetical protein M409DRAFT_60687 [Zasmidium cellare ATCC 36951]
MTFHCGVIIFEIRRALVEPHEGFLAYFDSLFEDCKEARWINDSSNAVDCLLQYFNTSDYALSNIRWPEQSHEGESAGAESTEQEDDEEQHAQEDHEEESEAEEGDPEEYDVQEWGTDEEIDHVERQEENKGTEHSNGELSTLSIEDALKLHVEIFNLGSDYDCVDLRDKAASKFKELLAKADWSIDQILPAAREIWASNFVDTSELRSIVCQWLTPLAGDLVTNDMFTSEVYQGTRTDLLMDLVLEMYYQMASRKSTSGFESDGVEQENFIPERHFDQLVEKLNLAEGFGTSRGRIKAASKSSFHAS